MNWGEELLKLLAVGAGGGIIGTIASPFAQDFVAKRSERREQRRVLVVSWREGIEYAMAWNDPTGISNDYRPSTLPHRTSAWAQTLMHHGDPKIADAMNKTKGWPGEFNELLDMLSSEVSRLARKWGVE